MKLDGKIIQPPKHIPIILPRKEGDIILHAAAVMTMDEFERLCPPPKPPKIFTPGKGYREGRESIEFKQAMDKWGNQRSNYMIIASLSVGTPTLEWDKVDLNDPETWPNYEAELSSVFTVGEVQEIKSGCIEANIPNSLRQEEALERFMSPRREEEIPSTSQKDEPDSTTSGEPVND